MPLTRSGTTRSPPVGVAKCQYYCLAVPKLASPVGRITERAKEQRDVVVLARIDDLEGDRDGRVEARLPLRMEVRARVEGQPEGASLERAGQEIADAAVGIGDAPAEHAPAPLRGPALEHRGHARRGAAQGRVEDVGRDRAHAALLMGRPASRDAAG